MGRAARWVRESNNEREQAGDVLRAVVQFDNDGLAQQLLNELVRRLMEGERMTHWQSLS